MADSGAGGGAAAVAAASEPAAKSTVEDLTLFSRRDPLFAALLPKMGLVVSLMLLIFISSVASHEFKLRDTALASVALLALSWVVFVKGLELQFPLLPLFLAPR